MTIEFLEMWKLEYTDAKSIMLFTHLSYFERMISIYLCTTVFLIHFAESIDKIGDNVKEVETSLHDSSTKISRKVYDKIVDKGAAVAGGLKPKFSIGHCHCLKIMT